MDIVGSLPHTHARRRIDLATPLISPANGQVHVKGPKSRFLRVLGSQRGHQCCTEIGISHGSIPGTLLVRAGAPSRSWSTAFLASSLSIPACGHLREAPTCWNSSSGQPVNTAWSTTPLTSSRVRDAESMYLPCGYRAAARKPRMAALSTPLQSAPTNRFGVIDAGHDVIADIYGRST
jgi:hypothetical protein